MTQTYSYHNDHVSKYVKTRDSLTKYMYEYNQYNNAYNI